MKHARKLPQSQRDDFVQDMWVRVLRLPDEQLTSMLAGTAFDLMFFRAMLNWKKQAKSRATAWIQYETEIAVMDEALAPSPERRYEAHEGISRFMQVLQESGWDDVEVRIIQEGICNELPQNEIAAKLGRSPQNFAHHFNKFRAAA
jgi:DNA-directed RNA polymerase specialized sigma24 family protein